MAGIEKNGHNVIDWIPIERTILNRDHPALVGVGPIAHSVYLGLVELCWTIQSHELPEPWCVIDTLRDRCKIKDGRTFCAALAKLRESSSISTGDLLENPRRFTFITVTRLEVKYPKRLHKRREEKREREKEGPATEKPSPTTPLVSFVSQFPEVIESLRSINAQGYRDLSGTLEFDKVLSAEKVRLGGLDRINREAQRFALYVEGQLQSGKEQRTKRSRPYKRFADWLAREKPGDNTHGNSSSVDEFGRKETPTGRMLRLAREEQAAECERAGSA